MPAISSSTSANALAWRAIVKAISRATRYATQHGVVVLAAAGNEATDLAHAQTDELSTKVRGRSICAEDVEARLAVSRAFPPAAWSWCSVGSMGWTRSRR